MSFVRYVVCKHFLPVCSLSFYPLNRVFHKANVFNFYKVQFLNSLFYRSCFWCHFYKLFIKPYVLQIFSFETATAPPSQPSLPTFLFFFVSVALHYTFDYLCIACLALLDSKSHWYRGSFLFCSLLPLQCLAQCLGTKCSVYIC